MGYYMAVHGSTWQYMLTHIIFKSMDAGKFTAEQISKEASHKALDNGLR